MAARAGFTNWKSGFYILQRKPSSFRRTKLDDFLGSEHFQLIFDSAQFVPEKRNVALAAPLQYIFHNAHLDSIISHATGKVLKGHSG